MMKARSRRRKKIRLLAQPHVEKAWAATMVLVAARPDSEWVHIDEIGDFLKKRQLDAHAVKFSERDPSTRYALRPGKTKFPKGWEDHLIATSLSTAADKKLIEHERREDGNYFRALSSEEHDLWGVVDDHVPVNPKWNL